MSDTSTSEPVHAESRPEPTCRARLSVVLADDLAMAHEVRCALPPHPPEDWHEGVHGTRWKASHAPEPTGD